MNLRPFSKLNGTAWYEILRFRYLMLLAALSPILFLPTHTQAADYGVLGALFPVQEPSVLDTSYARLHEL